MLGFCWGRGEGERQLCSQGLSLCCPGRAGAGSSSGFQPPQLPEPWGSPGGLLHFPLLLLLLMPIFLKIAFSTTAMGFHTLSFLSKPFKAAVALSTKLPEADDLCEVTWVKGSVVNTVSNQHTIQGITGGKETSNLQITRGLGGRLCWVPTTSWGHWATWGPWCLWWHWQMWSLALPLGLFWGQGDPAKPSSQQTEMFPKLQCLQDGATAEKGGVGTASSRKAGLRKIKPLLISDMRSGWWEEKNHQCAFLLSVWLLSHWI